MSKTSQVPEEGDKARQNTQYDAYRKVRDYLNGLPRPVVDELALAAAPSSAPTPTDPADPQQRASCAPDNFGIVELGAIYRSSYPKADDYDYLQSLGLKTILTLVPEQISPEYHMFMKQNKIAHFQVHIPANKGGIKIGACEMTRALEIVLDRRNHPMLIHCNKGKHRTGCVVGCFRRSQGQDSAAVYEEYHYYAGIKARWWDEAFIEQFNEGTVLFMARKYNWIHQIQPPTPPLTQDSGSAAGKDSESTSEEAKTNNALKNGLMSPITSAITSSAADRNGSGDQEVAKTTKTHLDGPNGIPVRVVASDRSSNFSLASRAPAS